MQVVTVSQLNRFVKSLIESDTRLAGVYISGEISNFTNHRSGHLYMSLKDEQAVVKAVMFRGAAMHLKFTPENGMKVIVRARVSLYEKDGAYQIYIEEMQPDGIGALQLAYEQLKKRLAAEGLFDEQRKRPLPKYPLRVGVVTSPTGAAVRDILNVTARRYPLAEIVMVPVLVQGSDAPPQLVRAIQLLNEQHAADVIIIGRGGGSIEDLWAFNDEGLARAIAASQIPVISAVGHETDYTICDFVADRRAPTPSAAAELAVPEQSELQVRLLHLRERGAVAVQNRLARAQQQYEALRQKRCLASPLYFVEEQGMRLDMVTRRFSAAAEKQLAEQQRRLVGTAGKLDALSPLKVLGRGYAIAYKGDSAVTSIAQVTTGDRLRVRLSDGEAPCIVQ